MDIVESCGKKIKGFGSALLVNSLYSNRKLGFYSFNPFNLEFHNGMDTDNILKKMMSRDKYTKHTTLFNMSSIRSEGVRGWIRNV